MHSLDDTIAAVATAPGGGARGVVRISGPRAVRCASAIFDFMADYRSAEPASLETYRRPTAFTGTLRLPQFAAPIPCDLFLWPTARSYTREPLAELHAIGSPPAIDAALRSVCEAGARLAEPGEFTLRAFLAGRIDLTQAEAVLGVIDAAGREQLDAALAQLAGNVARPLADLRERLLGLLAHLEAGLDFVEEDIEFIARDELDRQLAEAAAEVERLRGQLESRAESAPAARVVLVGWPNVGKSSLFNALVGREGAIVSPEPGTTRDYLTARLDLGRASCDLIDTAGLDPAVVQAPVGQAFQPDSSAVDQTFQLASPAALHSPPPDPAGHRAQAMTTRQHREAAIVLLCLDSTRPPNDWERAELAHSPNSPRLVVLTKCDEPLSPWESAVGWAESSRPTAASPIPTSARTGTGVADLRRAIAARLADLSHETPVAATAARCGESLRQAAAALTRARALAAARAGEDLLAADLRATLTALGHIAGTIHTDDLLDRIFSRFCIGK